MPDDTWEHVSFGESPRVELTSASWRTFHFCRLEPQFLDRQRRLPDGEPPRPGGHFSEVPAAFNNIARSFLIFEKRCMTAF